MIPTINKLITDSDSDVILNPIDTRGIFLLPSITKAYPRAVFCMGSIGKKEPMNLGEVYNYQESGNGKPGYLINMCCSSKSGELDLQAFEKALYIVATKFFEKKYPYNSISIPKPFFWSFKSVEEQCTIEDLIHRYFKDIHNLKLTYYYA